jgi:PAS domain S-box-containing protein
MNENISILIAGGAQAQALHLQSLLEQTGFQVTSASDGKEALILLLGGLRPALAIIDIEMPETDGYELCRKIRGDERFKEIFVTLLTRHSDPVDFVRVLECGANSFITKPYDEITLLSRIQYLVSNIIQRRDATDGTEVTVYFAGENYHIAAGRRQILDLLLSTYEKASIQNIELVETQNELIALNERLEKLVLERTAELADANKRLQVELAERKKTEEALAIEKNRFITASRAGRAALWEWEIRSATLEWSDIVDQMLGYEAGELPRTVQAWEELIHPDDYPRVMLALESHLGQEAPYDIEYRVRKKDGSYVWWRDSGACLRDGQGKAYQMSGVCTDITRKKKFQEAEIARISAETASRAKSDFLANMSHELRTPLNSVIGFSEVLMDRLYGPLNDKQEEYVNNIHISGRHLLSLINDILDLSKVESGRMELQLSSFSLKLTL